MLASQLACSLFSCNMRKWRKQSEAVLFAVISHSVKIVWAFLSFSLHGSNVCLIYIFTFLFAVIQIRPEHGKMLPR